MLKYLINALHVSILIVLPSFASCHVSDCDDRLFIELGKQYPSVGYFASPSGIFGSGTLIDIDKKELYGRVIITCGHIFNDRKNEDITFTLGDNYSKSGAFYIHPTYKNSYSNYGIEDTSFDIGLFILNEPLKNVQPAVVDFDISYLSLLDSNFASVGFGYTGHVLGKYAIRDLNKRASYAHAHVKDNPNQDSEITYTIFDQDSEDPRKINVVCKQGSVLTLTPYTSSKDIDLLNTLEVFQKPAGIAKSGDSGGGCFEAQSGKLIAVISGGTGPIKPIEHVLEQNYFIKYKEFLEKTIEASQTEYQNQLSLIKNSYPEKLKDFLQEENKPIMPRIIKAEEVTKLINTRYEKESFYYSEHNPCLQLVDQENVVISWHKNWINDILNTHIG